MKRLLSLLLAALLVMSMPMAVAEEAAEQAAEPDLTNAIFMVEDLIYDDDGSVLCIDGEYMYVGTDEAEGIDCLMPYGVDGTYALAEGCTFSMPLDMGDDDSTEGQPVDDLAEWYDQVILQGLELEEEGDFYPFTVTLTLNENDEVTHMEYVYTPWG